jgi:hypothetical protein
MSLDQEARDVFDEFLVVSVCIATRLGIVIELKNQKHNDDQFHQRAGDQKSCPCHPY